LAEYQQQLGAAEGTAYQAQAHESPGATTWEIPQLLVEPPAVKAPPLDINLTGMRLGSVRIERKLGAGGMGEMWYGYEEDLDIPVAVKILPHKYSSSQSAVLRFLREARAVARLDHPNIVRILQSGRREVAGQYLRVMVMEYVDGGDAFGAMTQAPGRKLDPNKVAEIGLGAARALRHAHTRGVIHRDIKPSNLLLPATGGVKVADFGLSRVAADAANPPVRAKLGERPGRAAIQNDVTMVGMVMGTPAYMSPEQGQGLLVDGRSDVYSLGISLFELLTGVTPFYGGDALSLVEKHIEAPIPFEARDFDHLPPMFRELITGMCEKLPEDRLGLGGVIAKLESFLGESSIVRSPESTAPDSALTRTNLSPRETSFVGRERDILALDQLFQGGSRLVTVMGPGGVGKTRLTQEFGLQEAGRSGAYAGGVWFCDLTESRSLESLATAVGRGLGLHLTQADPVQQVYSALRMRGPMLVILDNFEQVSEHAATSVGAWMRDTPHVRFLVSSREPLHLEGERLFGIDALDTTPTRKTPRSGVNLLGKTTSPKSKGRSSGSQPPEISPAVRLFADRAAMASRSFELNADNTEVIAEICLELDGIPLALELAAARVGTMSPKQILERLPKRFELLTSRRRDASARQATMRGAIDWSWNMLAPWERLALAQCGVFIDGFLMEAAERVLDLSAFPDAPFALDVIESLVEKSLLRAQDPPELPGETRYRMYESIRDYAQRKMSEEGAIRGAGGGSDGGGDLPFTPIGAGATALTGEAAVAALKLRHAEYYVAYASMWAKRIPTRGGKEALDRISMEIGNLFAIQDSMESIVPELSARAMSVCKETLKTRGPWQPRVKRITRAVAAASHGSTLKAELLVALALAHFDAGDRVAMESVAAEAEKLAHSIAASNPSAESLRVYAAAIGMVGQASSRVGRPDQALENYSKVEAICKGVNDQAGLAQNSGRIAQIHAMRGNFRVAIPYFQQAETISRALGHGPGISAALGNLGLCYADVGDRERALGLLTEAEQIDREQGNVLGVATWIGSRGNAVLTLGDIDTALECFAEAEQLCRELGGRASVTTWLTNRSFALIRIERFEEALECLAEAEATNREIANTRSLSYNLIGKARALTGMAQRALAPREELLSKALAAAEECQSIREKYGMATSPMYFSSAASHAFIHALLALAKGVATPSGQTHGREARRIAGEALKLADTLKIPREHHEPEVRMAFGELDRVMAEIPA